MFVLRLIFTYIALVRLQHSFFLNDAHYELPRHPTTAYQTAPDARFALHVLLPPTQTDLARPTRWLHAVWLLLLAGDIARNPGPRPTCPCCSKSVYDTVAALQCDLCNRWRIIASASSYHWGYIGACPLQPNPGFAAYVSCHSSKSRCFRRSELMVTSAPHRLRHPRATRRTLSIDPPALVTPLRATALAGQLRFSTPIAVV